MRINTNISAQTALRYLSGTTSELTKSQERLSTGLRINKSSDDPAGLAISQRMEAQIKGMGVALSNASNGISMLQTADGALDEIHSILQSMRALAVQASDSSLQASDLSSINSQLQSDESEINRIANATSFNGQTLLTGSLSSTAPTTQSGGTAAAGDQYNTTGGNASIQSIDVTSATAGHTFTLTSATAGVLTLTDGSTGNAQTLTLSAIAANSTETLNFGSLGISIVVNTDGAGKTAAGLATDLATKTIITAAGSGTGTATFQVGANNTANDRISVTFSDARIGSSGNLTTLNTDLTNFNVTQTVAYARALVTSIDVAVDTISSQRSTYGLAMNRIGYAASVLEVAQENILSAHSKLIEIDVAQEMTNFARLQILNQAGISVLAQANAAPQSVLKLLG